MNSIQQLLMSTPQTASSGTGVASALARPRAATAPTTPAAPATASSNTNPDTITANDFLTLLVAEMQNQDPTNPTDPNTYITQMVDVNSLQQLIGINSGVSSLDTAVGAAPPTSGSVATGGTRAAANARAVATADAMPSLFGTTSSGAGGTDVGASSGANSGVGTRAGSGSIMKPLWSNGLGT